MLTPLETGQATDSPSATPALHRDAARISDLVMSMIKSHGALRTRMAAGTDSDFSQLLVLVKLAALGPQRASALAEKLCADPSTVSRQVASLVRAGLVERGADPDDGRASILALTAAGSERVGEFADNRAQALAPIVKEWSAADRETFIQLLERYLAGLDSHRDLVVDRLVQAWPPSAAAVAVAVAPSERQVS